MALGTEGINEIGNKIFFGSARFEDFLFVFDDDFVVGDFDDLLTGDEKFGVDETFDNGALNDDLLDEIIVGIDGKIGDLTEFGTFFGFNFES